MGIFAWEITLMTKIKLHPNKEIWKRDFKGREGNSWKHQQKGVSTCIHRHGGKKKCTLIGER